MQSLINYPDIEKELKKQVDSLMSEWKKSTSENFTTDGFYPYYTAQKYRILFVGRESRCLTGYDYITKLYEGYKQNRIGNDHINRDMFHRRLLKIAYGLLNDFPEWKNVPSAQNITASFATPNGISFAFMNISKISNENQEYQSNWGNINKSINDAICGAKNYIKSEIELLAPDIIICSGVDAIHHIIGDAELLSEQSLIKVYSLWIAQKQVLLFNTYHFTARRGVNNIGLKDYDGFYLPIKQLFKQYQRLIGTRK